MKKLAALAGALVIALVPATADAHSKSKAKVYKGSFQLVGADGSYTTDSFGKAQLVVNKRNSQLSVHVRNLGSRVKYTFKLQSAAKACTAGAAGGTDVPGWKYRRGGVLFTNRKGVANSWAKARGFKVDPSVEYFVGIFDSTQRLVACAQLTSKQKAKKPHGHGNDKPKGGDKPHGNSNGHGQDNNGQGKDDKPAKTVGGDNGQNKDKGRGNDDKPDKSHGHGHDKGHA